MGGSKNPGHSDFGTNHTQGLNSAKLKNKVLFM
jgi:hypothetical protein